MKIDSSSLRKIQNIPCPKCDAPAFDRLPRSGFIQKYLLSALGYYPWMCTVCRHTGFLKRRSPGYATLRESEQKIQQQEGKPSQTRRGPEGT